MLAPTHRLVSLKMAIAPRASLQSSFWLTNRDLIARIRIEFMGKKGSWGELCQSNCLTEGFRGNCNYGTVPNRIVGCYTYC